MKRFNPIISRIRLNPEQAVLACTCWGCGRLNIKNDVHFSGGGNLTDVCLSRHIGSGAGSCVSTSGHVACLHTYQFEIAGS